jgi:hypothetical protein
LELKLTFATRKDAILRQKVIMLLVCSPIVGKKAENSGHNIDPFFVHPMLFFTCFKNFFLWPMPLFLNLAHDAY